MYKKYSKSYGDMWSFKESLTSDNDVLLNNEKRIAEFYKLQPSRNGICKICGSAQKEGGGARYSFHSLLGIKYFCCNNCGHINGEFQDTVEFSKLLYETCDENCFSGKYNDSDKQFFEKRIKTIYAPKAEFLLESLRKSEAEFDFAKLKFLDIGAGCGHFVKAMLDLSLDAIGIDVDERQVDYVNRMYNKQMVLHVPSDDVVSYLKNTKANVISAIYVLEHIYNFSDVMNAISLNKNIKYLYFSVPMMSVASILDSVTSDVYPRIIGSGHTHVFTDESIKWLCKKYGFEIKGEWKFGADMADFLRHIMVKAIKNGDSDYAEYIKKLFTPVMDELQNVLDRHGLCSDIHVLLKKQ